MPLSITNLRSYHFFAFCKYKIIRLMTLIQYVNSLMNFALTYRNRSFIDNNVVTVIAKDSCTKTKWLMVLYRKAHALFHAVKLSLTLIVIPVCQTFIAGNVLIQFGKYDQQSIELNNVGQLDADRIHAFHQKIKPPWESNLFISVLTYLLIGDQLSNYDNKDSPSKRNYMELSYFLSAVNPHGINYYIPGTLRKSLKDIKDLILRFTPIPPGPKTLQLSLKSDRYTHQQPIPEEYSFKGICKNNKMFDFLQGNLSVRTTPSRLISQRRRRRQVRRRRQNQPNRLGVQNQPNQFGRQRNINRSQFSVPIDNDDTLRRITSLPPQTAINSDPLIDQFFNGSSFF